MITSFFSKSRGMSLYSNFVSIARQSPVWFYGRKYEPLMPAPELLKLYKKGKMTWDMYEWEYNHQLESLDPKQVVEDLGTDAILLCWEPPNEHCHRHLVAKWLRSHGYEIEEEPL